MYLCLFTEPLGKIALYIALLLFGLNNKIPAILSPSSETEITNPEQALELLKDKLDLNMITKEEYKTKRAEIISKL